MRDDFFDGPWFGSRSGDTATWRRDVKTKSPNPIRALRQLPDGPVFELDAFKLSSGLRVWLYVGSHEDADICLPDDTVSELHAIVGRHLRSGHVFVLDCGSKNGVLVNDALVRSALLRAGDVVQIGSIELCACGATKPEQRPKIVAETLHDYVHDARDKYGSQQKAVEAVAEGHSRQSFSRWLRGYFRKRKIA